MSYLARGRHVAHRALHQTLRSQHQPASALARSVHSAVTPPLASVPPASPASVDRSATPTSSTRRDPTKKLNDLPGATHPPAGEVPAAVVDAATIPAARAATGLNNTNSSSLPVGLSSPASPMPTNRVAGGSGGVGGDIPSSDGNAPKPKSSIFRKLFFLVLFGYSAAVGIVLMPEETFAKIRPYLPKSVVDQLETDRKRTKDMRRYAQGEMSGEEAADFRRRQPDLVRMSDRLNELVGVKKTQQPQQPTTTTTAQTKPKPVEEVKKPRDEPPKPTPPPLPQPKPAAEAKPAAPVKAESQSAAAAVANTPTSSPKPVSTPTVRENSPVRPAPATPTPAAAPKPLSDFDIALAALADSEASLAPFLRAQESLLLEDLSSLERELKDRAARRLVSLELEQKHTLNSKIARTDRALRSAEFHQQDPVLREFVATRTLEEENKWRDILYHKLLHQNLAFSAEADMALQKEEREQRVKWQRTISKLRNAADARQAGPMKVLSDRLAQARHVELRSEQAHKLSSALLNLTDIVNRNHVPFESSWKVISEVAKQDTTLAAAIRDIAPGTVRTGIYSIASLKQAFLALSNDVRHSTFLPDEPSRWSVAKEALAHLADALTLTETGSVIIPVAHAQPAESDGVLARLNAAMGDHQAEDYAHYINASTYLNANALALALAELEAMQPARRALMARFIEELRKTVRVHRAIQIVRMRVLALNDSAAAAAAAAASK